jgi:hypothetical protein
MGSGSAPAWRSGPPPTAASCSVPSSGAMWGNVARCGALMEAGGAASWPASAFSLRSWVLFSTMSTPSSHSTLHYSAPNAPVTVRYFLAHCERRWPFRIGKNGPHGVETHAPEFRFTMRPHAMQQRLRSRSAARAMRFRRPAAVTVNNTFRSTPPNFQICNFLL